MKIFATRGFTLLELLVSISIFSIIGLGANQMLRTVMDSNERVRASTSTYTGLNLAFATMARDFNQFVPRPVRDGYGEPVQALVFESEDYAIEFTRGGWTNPTGRPRSKLQRVAYVVDYEEKTLKRLFWKVLDRAEDSEPVERIVLKGVNDLRITAVVVDETSEETETADEFVQDELEDEESEVIPAAVEVAIDTETLGEVVRVFQLVDTFEPGASNFNPGGDSRTAEPEDGEIAVEAEDPDA